MRITIRIDDDLWSELKDRARRDGVTLSESFNQAIRDGPRIIAELQQDEQNLYDAQ